MISSSSPRFWSRGQHRAASFVALFPFSSFFSSFFSFVLSLFFSVSLMAWVAVPAEASEGPAEVISKDAVPKESLSGGFAGVRDGVLSLGVALGSQAGPYGKEAAGLRYGVSDAAWTGLYFQVGHSETLKRSAAGAHLEFGFDLAQRDRSVLSLVPVVAWGYVEDLETSDEGREKTLFGASLGLQLEVFLLREVSTALRVEMGGQWEPADEARWSTASSEILFYYHFRT